MVDDFEYTYYLPVEVREAIKDATSFTIQVDRVKLSTYTPSEKSIADIKRVINNNKDLCPQLKTRVKASKINYLKLSNFLKTD